MGRQIFLAAFQTINFSQASMNFGHTPAAGTFMQSVYVLGDNVPQDPNFFKLHQSKVGGIGHIFTVVSNKLPPDGPVL